ncbi:MAG TPA: hypothetical protein DCL44_03830 [Elusimicrobia bacterium]|nr:hypothetical protein [Elusimicrobiota bacterium]
MGYWREILTGKKTAGLKLVRGTFVPWAAAALIAAFCTVPVHPANPATMQFTMTIVSPVPADIIDLAAAAVDSSGTIRLAWTDPGDDLWSGSVSSYTIKAATAANINTDAEFNANGPLSGFSNMPVFTPGYGGGPHVEFVTGLEPGVTYYFAIRATDNDAPPNTNSWSRTNGANPGNFAYIPDFTPPAPGNLTASVTSSTEIALSWDAVNVFDLNFYRIYVDYTAPYDFSDANVITVDSNTTSYSYTGAAVGKTYYYRVSAVDTGVLGQHLESAPSDTASAIPHSFLAPAVVAGISGALSTDSSLFTITWSSVTTNADGTPITDLSGYLIIKSTDIFAQPISSFSVSSSSTSFTDVVNNAVFYYRIRAMDTDGNESQDSSFIMSVSNPPTLIMGDDGKTSLSVPGEISAELGQEHNSTGSDLVIALTRLSAEETGDVLKSYLFEARRAENKQPVPSFTFSRPLANITFGLLTEGGVQALGQGDKKPVIYWDNGARFINLGGHINFSMGTVNVLSSSLGKYQLRLTVEAANAVLTEGSPYPRTITPNGDSINDRVFFFFEATNAPKEGRIYDLNGAFVGKMIPGPVQDSSLVWEGKDDKGHVVSRGIYLYKIDIGGHSVTGTVVVAR